MKKIFTSLFLCIGLLSAINAFSQGSKGFTHIEFSEFPVNFDGDTIWSVDNIDLEISEGSMVWYHPWLSLGILTTSFDNFNFSVSNISMNVYNNCSGCFNIILHKAGQVPVVIEPEGGYSIVEIDNPWFPNNPDFIEVWSGEGMILNETIYHDDNTTAGKPDGYPGTALDFDGEGEYVSTDIDVSPTEYPTMTWEAWVYPTRANWGTRQVVFSHDDGGWDRAVTIEAGTSNWAVHRGGGAWEAVPVDLNTWQHIAVVFDNDNQKIYFYKNGTQYTYTGTNYTSSVNKFNIGRTPLNGQYFQGKIDEGRIWNDIRTQQEIRESMHLPLAGTESGLISYWQFNEGSGVQAFDKISGNYGTLHCTGYYPNIWVNSTIPFGLGSSFTQVYPSGTVLFTGTGLSMEYNSTTNDILTVARIDTLPNIIPEGPFVVLDEQYWVVNRYGTGTFDASLTFTTAEKLTADPFSLLLFSRSSTSDTEWMYVTSASSVDSLNKKATFDGITHFSQFIIVKLNDLDIDGFPGTSLSFDGGTDYVECGNDPDLNIASNITVEAWVKPHSMKANSQIIKKGELSFLYWDAVLEDIEGKGIQIYLPGLAGYWEFHRDMDFNTWVHVAWTFDDSGNLTAYVNGEITRQSNFPGSISMNTDALEFASSTDEYNGLLDEVRIWNVVRTSEQIRESMHLPLTGEEPGLINYWQFNEGIGTTAIDLISGNHGTFRNMDYADWIGSTIPFGAGFANSQPIESLGTVDFTGTGFSMYFNNISFDTLTVSRVNLAPNLLPDDTTVLDKQYWVVDRFETGALEANLIFTPNESLAIYDENNPSNIRLYSRSSTSDTDWAFVASASSVNATENQVTFNGISDFGQFILAKTHSFIELDLKVFLEGPFNGTEMNTHLNSASVLPLDQPYTSWPWNYSGTESVMSFPSDIVDWIIVELREAPSASAATTAPYVIRQAAFILKDGSVVDADGLANPEFVIMVKEQLFVVVWHRSHPGIMSAVPLTESGGIYSYDFSSASGQSYDTGSQKDLGSGVYGMFAGDANADGIINDTDKDPVWNTQAGIAGYLSADLNMDGQCNNKDKDDLWFPNRGCQSQIPLPGGACPGTITVTDMDGNVYNTILIGDQCWFKENLNVGTMINGSNDPSNNGIIEKFCHFDDPNKCITYGGLYQWHEMMNYTWGAGRQGICPVGWHIPTQDEWTILADFLGGTSVAGGKMKEVGTTHWTSPNSATNESGFTALPGGSRSPQGFAPSGLQGFWWESNNDDSKWAIYHSGTGFSHQTNYYDDKGYSVRCLRDN
ncbi:MAG: hypothetical protein DRJ05_09935 [Bacteroidetes bacterium]|nr:MAG: hypothetical protein DRJ05_09935 [Bacteroidota bacterium]